MMVNPFLPTAQDVFLSLVPRIERHGRVFFRHLKCPHRKQDAVSEMVALAWKWFLRFVERGKDPTRFPSALATYAAKAVNSGRKLAGMDKAKDVLSPRAQKEKGFTVASLPNGSSLHGNVFDEALQDNTRSEVPDQVHFRIDFPAWRLTRTERDRRLIDDLMLGHRTLDVARRYGLSQARVSQLRREFQEDWQRFNDEPLSTPA